MNFKKLIQTILIQSFLFGLLASGVSAQEPSVFDQVDECDLLAAHPDDSKRMAQGVADDEIVPLLAIEACEKALNNNPGETRFVFQLGRAFLAYGKKEKAFGLFQQAKKSGYAVAFAYLGDAYQFGLGTKKDPTEALAHYEASIKAGFEAAKEQVKRLKFDKSLFVSFEIGKIYLGEYQSVREMSKKAHFRNYLFNFAQTFITQCGSFLTPKNVPKMFFYRYPPGWTAEKADGNIMIAIQTSVGEFDAEIFLKKYGCEGFVAKSFLKKLDKFFATYSR